MIASVETDVFALDLAPAAKLGRDSLFLSPAYRFLSPDRMTAFYKLSTINFGKLLSGCSWQSVLLDWRK